MRSRTSLYLLLMLALLTGSSCSPSGPQIVMVHGTATHEGKPIIYAEVNCDPQTEDPNGGRTSYFKIVDGKFDTRPGGVVAGPAEVTVTIIDLPATFKPKNWDSLEPEEDSVILRAKKIVVTKTIDILEPETTWEF